MTDKIQLLDSITDATAATTGQVVVSGSHGGFYPAAVASGAGARAVLFNDAGIGLEQAGVAGVLALGDIGMAAAGVDCQSCKIGSAADTLENGVISVVNRVVETLGLVAGMPVATAIPLLENAPMPQGKLPPYPEARQSVQVGAVSVELLDSASLVGPQDSDKIVITGSHGGLIGGNPARAIKAPVRIAVFNDAGFGKGDIGISRLPALDVRDIAAVTVSCQTARIGDAKSALETGVISALNDGAQAQGAQIDMHLATWLATLH